LKEKNIFDDLIESAASCRFCGHIKMGHKFIERGSDKMRCIEGYLDENGVYAVCQCEDFAPKDNLEFLQWKHTKRKK
jgi:hypothetical protein